MFHPFDLVTLKKPLSGSDVPIGTEGTIIRIFRLDESYRLRRSLA